MAIYLVDFENVNCSGIKAINQLSKNDYLYIFYTPNANTITIDLHKKLLKCNATVDFIAVTAGTNSLDFQLSTYLGYLVAKNEAAEFFIISKDKGFKAIKAFWNAKNIKITILEAIGGKDIEKTEKDIEAQFTDNDIKQTVISYVNKYKTKNGIYNALVKQYQQKKGLEIYNQIKPFIKDKK